MTTIKELAEQLGVSKTAIRKYMTPDFREQHTQTGSGNVITIDSAGCEIIAKSLRKSPETDRKPVAETTANQVFTEEIAFLRSQLEAKDRQIEAQQSQIAQLTAALEHTTASLQAAQALHAGTMQQQLLEEPAVDAAEAVPASPEPEQAKRSLWQWLFGR